jgi:hypothetical protein
MVQVNRENMDLFAHKGWLRIGPCPEILAWSEAALPQAIAAIEASHEAWRSGETWFAGVDALPNGPDGAMGGCAFPWGAMPVSPQPLHPGQLSTMRPGYPRPGSDESPAAFAFRQKRDAAHLDGLLPFGPQKARYLVEPHAFVLGLPLTSASPQAAPLVVWEGSHHIMRAYLEEALLPHPPQTWGDIDITAPYKAARRAVFDQCPRVTLPASPGEATFMHRLALHGVAPWAEGASADAEGRVIAYFRPHLPCLADWLMNDEGAT